MKRYTSLALIGVLVVGIAGFISLDAISATSFVTMKAASDIHETGQMIGHVTYELRGADGNIKHYVQSDNVIVHLGTDCAAQVIFDTTDDGGGIGENDVCTPGGNGGFAFIAIGNATISTDGGVTGALNEEDDIVLDTSDGGVANFGNVNFPNAGDEMARSGYIDATITAAVGSGLDTTVSIASPAFSFTDLRTGGTVVTQSGLFDSAGFAAGNMFSIRDIPPAGTGLTVTNADTLSITWTITLQ